MAEEIRYPTVESVERLYELIGGESLNTSRTLKEIHNRNKQRSRKVLKVISKEVGAPVSGTGISQVASLFTCEIIEKETDGTLTATGFEIEVWNDFTDTIAIGQILEVVRCATTPYYKIVVFYC